MVGGQVGSGVGRARAQRAQPITLSLTCDWVRYCVAAGGAEVRVELEEAADDALGNVFLAFGGFGTADDELYEALGVGEGAEGCGYAPQRMTASSRYGAAAPAAESIFAD